MTRAIVFDVNETLLDLRALDPLFEKHFGDPSVRGQWFQQMLQLAFLGGITGRYVDFTAAQHAGLRMVALRRGMALSGAAAREIVGGMTRLPPHPDVVPALDRLREAGLTLATLTNSTLEVATAQLAFAGIADRFARVLSADEVKRLKPAPEAYRMAAQRLGTEPPGIRLVAAHAWDIAGALAAGCAAGFVERPGMVLDPDGEQPDVVGKDLGAVADAILERDR